MNPAKNPAKMATARSRTAFGRSLKRVVLQPGVRVLITGNHPWTGHSGVVEERIATLVGCMWRVNLDNGMNAGVYDGNIKAV